ncbi:50S ribosomal protein L17 [bacterium]|nr:50S ribosomal protein L17 [bacterium]
MRHRKSGRRLGVPSNRRKAMLKQLVEALFLHGRIKTTLARAKETRQVAERMVTLAKKGSLHHRRQAMSVIVRRDVVNRLFDHIVEWYKERNGGYTRIIKIGNRKGDAAPVAFLELVDWIPGDKLTGQLTKLVKSETGEEEGEGKAKVKEKTKKVKEKQKKEKKDKKEAKKIKAKKVTKSPEKEKKIAERKAEKEKTKKESASEREKKKKERLEKKTKAKPKAKKAAKKVKKVVKKAKKKVVKKVKK